jgi:hypothetical protein
MAKPRNKPSLIKPSNKPFSKTELKILVFSKMRKKGMSYEQAYDEIKKEIALCNANHYKAEKMKNPKKNFKEEFENTCSSKI